MTRLIFQVLKRQTIYVRVILILLAATGCSFLYSCVVVPQGVKTYDPPSYYGWVADWKTELSISGAVVRFTEQEIEVKTDAVGKFEFPSKSKSRHVGRFTLRDSPRIPVTERFIISHPEYQKRQISHTRVKEDKTDRICLGTFYLYPTSAK